MVLLHRRELLIPAHSRWIVAALAAGAMACGGSGEAEEETAGVVAEQVPVAERVVPDGDPMPPADVSGVPPYPGAVVWRLSPRRISEFDAIEAFTTDDFADVVAFYDERLGPPWRRERFEDAVTYTLDPDMGAVMLSPWNGALLPEDSPEPLKRARTGIGVSWRKEGVPPPADSTATAGT